MSWSIALSARNGTIDDNLLRSSLVKNRRTRLICGLRRNATVPSSDTSEASALASFLVTASYGDEDEMKQLPLVVCRLYRREHGSM